MNQVVRFHRELVLFFILAGWSSALFAAEYATFAPNPPDKEFDYYSSNTFARKRIKVVEEYHWTQGLECMAKGRNDCAHNHFDFILKWVPNHPNALASLSQLSIKRGDADAVTPYLDYAIRRYRGKDASSYIVSGIHLHRIKKFDEAIEMYQKADAIDPNSNTTHYNMGLAYFAKGDYPQANEHAQKAYRGGYRVPALKEKLKSKGAWNPDV